MLPEGQAESLRAELEALIAEKADLVHRLTIADDSLVPTI